MWCAMYRSLCRGNTFYVAGRPKGLILIFSYTTYCIPIFKYSKGINIGLSLLLSFLIFIHQEAKSASIMKSFAKLVPQVCGETIGVLTSCTMESP